MKLNELKLILKQLNVSTIKETKPGQIQISCPLAEWFHDKKIDRRPSMGINYGGEVTIFKCFTCGESGKLWNLVDTYGTFKKDESIKRLALQVLDQDKPSLASKLAGLELDEWYPDIAISSIALDISVLDQFSPFNEVPESLDYICLKRKIKYDIAEKFRLMYDRRKSRVIFPVFCNKGILRGAVGRTIKDEQPRYYNYFGFRTGDTLGALDKVYDNSGVMLVEGFFDLLRCWPYCDKLNYSVVCSWRADITVTQAEILSGLDKTIYVWYDMDKTGDQGWETLKELFKSEYGL